jgi:hypothetical protein
VASRSVGSSLTGVESEAEIKQFLSAFSTSRAARSMFVPAGKVTMGLPYRDVGSTMPPR